MHKDLRITIAEATKRLILEKNAKKLTVRAIAEECHITRQSFYYHFKGIPELFIWMLEQDSDQLLENAVSQENAQEGLRYLLLMAINLMPYIRQGADAFYQEELVRILQAYIYRFFLNAGNKRTTIRDILQENAA